MPLAFNSISHGVIPFGFFNIKTDMLLLDRYAFFATDLCELLKKMIFCCNDHGFDWEIFQFISQRAIGDLHGGISGKKYEGFIGSVYSYFPFPRDLLFFKQATDGYKTQKIILSIIESYSEKIKIKVITKPDLRVLYFGEYRFSFRVFMQMIKYVMEGGYPRWENGIAPKHVEYMERLILRNSFLNIKQEL